MVYLYQERKVVKLSTFRELQETAGLYSSAFSDSKLEDWEYLFYIQMGVKFGLKGAEFDKLISFLQSV
jgi:hypothetical protein